MDSCVDTICMCKFCTYAQGMLGMHNLSSAYIRTTDVERVVDGVKSLLSPDNCAVDTASLHFFWTFGRCCFWGMWA